MKNDSKRHEKTETEDIVFLEKNEYHLQLAKDVKEQTAELNAIKELLEAAINSTLDVIQVFQSVRDKDNKIIDFIWLMNNKEGVKQKGDVVGQSLLSKHPEIVTMGLFEKMVSVVETGIPIEHEQFYNYEQLETWYYQAFVRSGDGLVMTSRDITRHKKADQELLRLKDIETQKVTDKYYSIINSVDEGFCIYELIYDADGKVVDLRWVEVNPAYEKQTGLKDTIGKLASDVMPGTESYWLEVYDSVVKTGKVIHFETWHEPTGRWYNTFASRVGGVNNKQVGVVFSDTTERKRREQQQEFLLKFSEAQQSLSDAAVIEDTTCHLLGDYFNVS